MNWGHKITIVIVAFIIIMLSMVYVAMRQTNEMEDANYYDKELKYQNKIDAANNLSASGTDSILSQNSKAVMIQIPKKLIADFKNGTLEFLKSDDQKKDLNLSFKPDTAGIFSIEKSKFVQGFYKARISWDNGAEHYYKEETISVLP